MSLARLAAVVRADVLVRFRRLSTLVVFLLLSALPYVWIPDPASGRALMASNGQRVLYDSAALGMATGSIAGLFVGLFGFYVISNAIKRDVQSRCGFVIAATPAGSGEYLLGKLVGNVVFLTTFVGGFMLTSMAMQLVRGEAPLEPLTFALQYLLLVPPVIALVSVLAIVFESIPWLSGRLGDVVYFFLWAASFAVVAQMQRDGGPAWLALFDYMGFGYLTRAVQDVFHTTNFSIGASEFDAAKGTLRFPGMPVGGGWAWRRAGCALTPLPLLLIARWSFHRFDPARLRRAVSHQRRGVIARVNGWLKPLARRVAAALAGGDAGTSLLAAARADALLTLTNLPLALVAGLGFAIAAVVATSTAVAAVVFPLALAALAIVVADVATRDRTGGTLLLVFSAPALREGYVRWKLSSTVVFGIGFLALPLLRIAGSLSAQLFGAVVGVLFVCATATALGVVTGNPKTFLVAFLSFSYVAMSDKAQHLALDFAGLHAQTPWTVAMGYLLSAIALAVLADGWHRWQLARA